MTARFAAKFLTVIELASRTAGTTPWKRGEAAPTKKMPQSLLSGRRRGGRFNHRLSEVEPLNSFDGCALSGLRGRPTCGSPNLGGEFFGFYSRCLSNMKHLQIAIAVLLLLPAGAVRAADRAPASLNLSFEEN